MSEREKSSQEFKRGYFKAFCIVAKAATVFDNIEEVRHFIKDTLNQIKSSDEFEPIDFEELESLVEAMFNERLQSVML
jgi:hypothetical protein